MAKKPAEKTGAGEHKCRCPFCDVEVIFKMKEVPVVCQGCQVLLHLCPKCGKPLPRDAANCPSCGAKLR
jgi:predicted amidophosphoribosyltransferase